MHVVRSTPQGGGSLRCGPYLLAPLTEKKEGAMQIMLLRVRPTSTGFSANIRYTTLDNARLYLYEMRHSRGASCFCLSSLAK